MGNSLPATPSPVKQSELGAKQDGKKLKKRITCVARQTTPVYSSVIVAAEFFFALTVRARDCTEEPGIFLAKASLS